MSKSKKELGRSKNITVHYMRIPSDTREEILASEAFKELFEKAEDVYRSLTSKK